VPKFANAVPTVPAFVFAPEIATINLPSAGVYSLHPAGQDPAKNTIIPEGLPPLAGGRFVI